MMAADSDWRLAPDAAGSERADQLGAASGITPLLSMRWALRVMSGCYAAGAALHRGLYTRGVLQRRRLPCRVVSVGGISVGGSGKTPLAAWLASRLHERGHRVALASRGYGREGREPLRVVSDGRSLCPNPTRSGDEPLVLAAHAPGVPVLVARDRGLAGLHAVSNFDCEILVLDDGFQHHRLWRDLEIVCLDAGSGLSGGRVLPEGPLREGLASLARADGIGVVDGSLAAEDAARLDRHAAAGFRFTAARVPVHVRGLAGGESLPPQHLAGRDVGLIAAVANPAGLRRTLQSIGVRVVAQRLFRDHHLYCAGDLQGLAEHAPIWITTEKDAVKILPSWLAGQDLRVLRIAVEIQDPDVLLNWVETRLGIQRVQAREDFVESTA